MTAQATRLVNCTVLGRRGDQFFITIGVEAGPIETFKMTPTAYYALLHKAVEALSSESLERLRQNMVKSSE